MTAAPGPPRRPTVTPDQAAAATLAALPGITPARLQALLSRWPDPSAALAAVVAGRGAEAIDAPGLASLWATEARPEAMAARLAHRQTRVLLASEPGFPILEGLPGRPAVLFAEGERPEALDAPRVAVVGTRAATPYGLADAREVGEFLGASGVSVVSGLAIGIDGAAHLGALTAAEAGQNSPECAPRAGPIGVVATGIDVVYPRRHAPLFERIRRAGLLVGEHAFGVAPTPVRFPVRNRIIAALSDLLVVVEATLTGGSRITAERALDYGRPVLAIPGSRRNPAAAGCNALLADGAQPLIDPSDILLALGMTPGVRRGWSRPAPPVAISPTAARIKDVLAGEPAHPDQLANRTGLDSGDVALAVEELVALGCAKRDRGFVWPLRTHRLGP